MKFWAAASKAAFVGTAQLASRRQGVLLLCPKNNPQLHPLAFPIMLGAGSYIHFSSPSRLFSSSNTHTGNGGEEVTLRNIGKEEMEEIIEDYEAGGREESGYLILDVRELHEIASTGKLSPNTQALPLQSLLAPPQNAFALDDDEFEHVCGFAKPTPDETLVFSCAAGIRSVHAAKLAAMNGYTKLINYKGGANEWFW